MKIGGIVVDGPNESVLHLPHGDTVVEFRARALLDDDFDRFNAICPYPIAPTVKTRDGKKENTEDVGYKQQVANYEVKRQAWMVITSLEPSNIEWPSVDPENPSTWKRFRKDLTDAGFGAVQINRIVTLVMQANCLDESKLAWAREVFVRGQQETEASSPSSPNSEQTSTPSGEAV